MQYVFDTVQHKPLKLENGRAYDKVNKTSFPYDSTEYFVPISKQSYDSISFDLMLYSELKAHVLIQCVNEELAKYGLYEGDDFPPPLTPENCPFLKANQHKLQKHGKKNIYKKSLAMKLIALGHNFLYSARQRGNPKYQIYCFEDTPELQKDMVILNGQAFDKKKKH